MGPLRSDFLLSMHVYMIYSLLLHNIIIYIIAVNLIWDGQGGWISCLIILYICNFYKTFMNIIRLYISWVNKFESN